MKWTEDEIQVLKKKYPEKGSDIAELKQNRSREAIRGKAKRLDIATERKASNPEKINKNNYTTGYIVGSVVGDGCIKSNETRISFTQKDEDYINKLILCFKKLTSKKPSKYTRKDGYYEISYNSKKWVPELEKIIENVLQDKENKNKDFKKGYLSGLFDSEGSVTENNKCISLKLTMTTPKAVKKYSNYLNDLNIKTFVREGTASYDEKKKIFSCNIGKHYEIKKFEEKIPLGIERKQEKISSYIKNKTRKNTQWSQQELQKLKDNYSEKGAELNLKRPKGSIKAKASELDIKYRG